MSAAYGLTFYRIKEKDLTNGELMNQIFTSRNCVIEYLTEGITTVSPKLEYNKPIEMPMPQLPMEEHFANMLTDNIN